MEVNEINEKLELLIDEAKRIWLLYGKLKKYELVNNGHLYDKTLTNLKYEVMLEDDLYEDIDPEERIIIAEYLNNYKFDSENNNGILNSQLNLSVNDAIVERIKTRIANLIIYESKEEYDNFTYDTNDKEIRSILVNCSKNFYNNQTNISEYGILDSLINVFSRNYYNILCSQIDICKNVNVKEQLINHKYNLLYCDNLIESKILTTNNHLLNFYELDYSLSCDDCNEFKDMVNEKRDELFDSNYETDIEKLIELSKENINSNSFQVKKALIYSSIRSNIEVLNDVPADNIVASYVDEVVNNNQIENKESILTMLDNLKNNLKNDWNNINSIRITNNSKKLKKY